MISFRKNKKILNLLAFLILVISGSFLITTPRPVDAHTFVDISQGPTRPVVNRRGGNFLFLVIGLAAPQAAPTPDIDHTNEDTPIDINVLNNDGGPTTISGLITSGTQGAVSINNVNQTIHYDPTVGLNHLTVGQVFTDTFQYTVISGTLPINTQVSVGVTGVNDNPMALNDTESIGENAATDFSNLLVNDSDPDTGDTALLTIQSVDTTGGTKGTVTINSGGKSVHYDPGTAFNSLGQGQTATDTFGYTVSDGHSGSASATVTVTINGANDNPTPVNDVVSTGENTAADFNVLTNDTDPDTGDTALLTIQSVDTTGGTKGTVTINTGSKSVHYNPGTAFDALAQGQTATDTFGYTVSDGHGGSATAMVTVTITGANDPPTAAADSYNTNEDTPQNYNLLNNDTDPDTGDVLTIQSINTVGTLGTVTIDPGGTSVHYDPVTAFNNLYVGQVAVDTFSYTMTDGHNATSTATVTVTVTGVNDNPTPKNDTATTGENTAFDINASNLLSNDTDPDGDPLSVTGVTSSGTKGSVSWNGTSQTVHYNPGTAFDSLPYNGAGTDTFQYTVCDNHSGCSNATVTVTINGANDNPTPVNDAVSTGENTAANFNVLSNDSDPDTNDTLTISALNNTNTKGVVTINAGNNSVHYDPGMAFNSLGRSQTATDSFAYTVSDGHGGSASATVTVTIIGANDPPTANNDTYTTPANTKLTIAAPGILANDSDPDTGDILNPALVINPSYGVLSLGPSGGFVYTPTLNYHGLDRFIYHASDGLLSSPNVTVTIGVDVTNKPPVVVADTSTSPEDTPVDVHVLANDYDPDGNLNLSTLKVTTSPNHGTTQVNTATGVITYRPALNYNGDDTFQYEIYDKDSVLPLSGRASVTITITPVNDPPQAADLQKSTPEDTSINIDLSGSISDVDNNLDLSSLQVITPAGHGTAAKTANLIITYTPATNYNGPDLVGYRICDQGSLCARAKITIDVTPVNDPPVAMNDRYYTRPISLTVDAPGVLSNDHDVDPDDHMKVSLVMGPINGQLKLNDDGSFRYTPNHTFISGNDRFSYQVYDSMGALSNTARVTITVDTSPPDLNWQSPMGNGEIYYASHEQQVPLVITATDNIPISQVEFFWWDAKKGGTGAFVDIASLSHAPFRALVNVYDLNIGWNQIFARAYDAAGNVNNLGDPSHPGFIWIIRQENVYIPLISLGGSP